MRRSAPRLESREKETGQVHLLVPRSQSRASALDAKLQPYVPSEETRGTGGSLVTPCGTDLLTSYWSRFREAVPTVLCTATLRAGAWQQWGHGTPPPMIWIESGVTQETGGVQSFKPVAMELF